MQHAGLAVKNPDNLDAIKLHAGHVIHALDPAVETRGRARDSAPRKRRLVSLSTPNSPGKSQGASFVVAAKATQVAGGQ